MPYITYILLGAVMVIWGVIGYRFLGRQEGEALSAASVSNDRISAPVQAYPPKLNYRDPFFSEPPKEPERILVPVTVQLPAAVEAKEPILIECLGQITRGGEHFYLISMELEHHAVQQGDCIGGLRVSKIERDSIYFVKGKWVYAAAIPEKQ